MKGRYIQYNHTYVVLIARVIDIAMQTFIWRDYDITISAQVGLLMRGPSLITHASGVVCKMQGCQCRPPLWARALNALLNWLEPHHCELAIACDIERAEQALKILHGAEKP